MVLHVTERRSTPRLRTIDDRICRCQPVMSTIAEKRGFRREAHKRDQIHRTDAATLDDAFKWHTALHAKSTR